MNLDRNQGRGKYSVLLNRRIDYIRTRESAQRFNRISMAIRTLEQEGVLIHGEPKTQNEFFVLKLQDRHSQDALIAYAASVREFDPEYAADIDLLATRAGPASIWDKEPD